MKKNRRKKIAGAVILMALSLGGLTACSGSSKEREWKTEFSSTDWKTLEFSLGGWVYTFPVAWSDLEAAGYQIDKSYRQQWLEPGYYTTGICAESKDKEGESFYVRLKNFEEKDRRLKDCEVYQLSFQYWAFEDANPEVILCNGVTFGMTAEEVKSIMGEPYSYSSNADDEENTYGHTHETMIYYVTDSVWESKLEFAFMDGALHEIDIRNTD